MSLREGLPAVNGGTAWMWPVEKTTLWTEQFHDALGNGAIHDRCNEIVHPEQLNALCIPGETQFDDKFPDQFIGKRGGNHRNSIEINDNTVDDSFVMFKISLRILSQDSRLL